MDWTEPVKNVVETIAIVVAGFWTYALFIRHRQKFPHADLLHQITHAKLPDGRILLFVNVIVRNLGQVLIKIVSGKLQIYEVVPLEENVLSNSDKSYFPINQREFPWKGEENIGLWGQALLS